ncbi:hypothetical protein, partial [Kocuria dechangensis]|uniref:hypothetical protein n=1 Tax=Kocuria dechangensis TaxID=1176249 RepID=UPI001E644AA8
MYSESPQGTREIAPDGSAESGERTPSNLVDEHRCAGRSRLWDGIRSATLGELFRAVTRDREVLVTKSFDTVSGAWVPVAGLLFENSIVCHV